jgi:p24 family protein beta-1
MFWLVFAWSLAAARRRPDLKPPIVTQDGVLDEKQTSSQELMQEWDEKMKGFLPEDLTTFELPTRSEVEFYETVDFVPSTIRGAWFLASDNSKDVEFRVLDPSHTVIFERKNRRETVFKIEATKPGEYVFRFNNHRVMQAHLITFTFHNGNSTNALLRSSHLSPIEHSLLSAETGLKSFEIESSFGQLRQETQFQVIASANTSVFWLSLAESLGIILVTLWQVYYIKRLLNNRRVL